jgi:tetratricopeptide (TPR) repeat protein
VTGDVQVFSLTYVKLVLGLRPDVTVYDSKRIIFGDQYGFLLWPMISLYHPPLSFCGTVENETHKWGRPVYYGWYKTKQEMPGWWLCPNGLLYRVFPEGYRWRPPENFLKIYNVRGLWDKTAPKDFLDEEIASHYEKTLTEYILTELGQIFLAKNDLKKAKEAFIKALRFAPDFVPAYEGLIEIAKRSNDHQAWQYCLSRIEKIEKDYGY